MSNKAILMSIQPKWCELIANGKKTVEVRKTKPKLETPFKVYIYCTKGSPYLNRHNNRIYLEPKDTLGGRGYGTYERLSGEVIGEFICNKIDRISHCGTSNKDIRLKIVDKNWCFKELDYEYLNKCQLSYFDINEYTNGCDVYAWHISNLVIYDKPRELNNFYVPVKDYWETYDPSNYINGCWQKPLQKPPQSWCYIKNEVLKNDS